ncbi:pyridoxal phosphate-dependent aminotransferase [Edaphobacter albus]|uniref:pyridoxal phosphate-dependent aminotransferase n=1 Tax=Edaphobacter sp. 4G125 TaxID=2763071 RepID=UPI0016456468|nr:pyridoxal phosphate-dependent aminotransferase [Edaphobacter sp. 4G125]QNI36769.1 pyridoxal phosphate-dependent aminotransferase [Edaphobacter sp. 4G125]
MVQAEVAKGRGLGLSELAPRVAQSEIRAMSVESDRVGGVNLAQGVCDTEVPQVVTEGAIAAIRDGHNIYTRLDGIQRLRRAIAGKVESTLGLVADPEREILVASGATGAFHAVAMALFNPGDEVLLFEPFYGYHVGTLRSLRVTPVAVELEGAEWKLDLDRVRAAITPKTRAVVVNTPSNPAGKVFTREELEGLAEIAREHDLFVLTDEIYEHFLYGDAKHISPATLHGMRERTIVMSGFSKTFSVTGWRIGYVIADAKWLPAIAYFHDLLYVCAPAPFQHGVAAGIEQLGPTFYARLALDHEAKREMLVSALRDAGLSPHVPDGAYYILASTKGLESVLSGETAAQRARSLLAKTGVAAVAGSAFFRAGKGEDLLRFCFAKKDEDLAEACKRLRSLR